MEPHAVTASASPGWPSAAGAAAVILAAGAAAAAAEEEEEKKSLTMIQCGLAATVKLLPGLVVFSPASLTLGV